MMAFVSGAPSIALNTPGRHARLVCKCRPSMPRPARVVFSALIDEKKALSEPDSDRLPGAVSRDKDEPQRLKTTQLAQDTDSARAPAGSPRSEPRRFSSRPRFQRDPEATYYTKCSKCSAAYELDPSVLAHGRRVACSVCGNEWFQKPERLFTLRESEQFTDYPMDKKDEILQQNQQRGRNGGKRRDRQSAGKSFSVFIGNLPFSVSEEELQELIQNVVSPKRVAVVVDSDGRSKGYAFADVNSSEEVEQLVQTLDNTPVKGRNISVRPGRRNS